MYLICQPHSSVTMCLCRGGSSHFWKGGSNKTWPLWGPEARICRALAPCPRGGTGVSPPENFWNLHAKRCIFLHSECICSILKFFWKQWCKTALLGAKTGITSLIFGVEKKFKNLQKGLFVQILNMGDSKGGSRPPSTPTWIHHWMSSSWVNAFEIQY